MPLSPSSKRCPSCGETKPQEGFYRSARHKDGMAGYCKACSHAKRLTWARSNIEKDRAWVRTGQARITPEERRAKNLMQRFKLTPEDYDAMLTRQGGACATCRRPPGERPLAVDHDHACCPGSRTCGKCVRGLLCFNCNGALGHVRDSVQTLRALIDYIGG